MLVAVLPLTPLHVRFLASLGHFPASWCDPQHRFPTRRDNGQDRGMKLRETVPLHPSYRAMAEAACRPMIPP